MMYVCVMYVLCMRRYTAKLMWTTFYTINYHLHNHIYPYTNIIKKHTHTLTHTFKLNANLSFSLKSINHMYVASYVISITENHERKEG